METVKAISQKRLVGSVSLKELSTDKTLWLFRVVGVCIGVKERMGDSGPQVSYTGDFIAKTDYAGKNDKLISVRADTLFLNDVGNDMMEAAGVTKDADGFYDVALKVGAKLDGKGRAAYVVEWLQKPSQSTPAEALAQKIAPDMLTDGATTASATAPSKKK